MAFLRQWLLGVVSCAFLVSLLDQLTPEGSVRKLARFSGGLVLILCMLRPRGGGAAHCGQPAERAPDRGTVQETGKTPEGGKEAEPRGTLPVEVEESLKQALGSEVNVAYHGGKGKLTVHFYSDEQLRAFANLLGQYQLEQ